MHSFGCTFTSSIEALRDYVGLPHQPNDTAALLARGISCVPQVANREVVLDTDSASSTESDATVHYCADG